MKTLKTKKADLELDQLGKLILAGLLLVIILAIITLIITGEFTNQLEKIKEAFRIFK